MSTFHKPYGQFKTGAWVGEKHARHTQDVQDKIVANDFRKIAPAREDLGSFQVETGVDFGRNDG